MCTAEESSQAEFERQLVFTELLQESRSRLYGYLFALTHSASDADDLFQTTAAILWEKFDTFQTGTDFTAWSLRVGNLVYRNFARSRRRRGILLSDESVSNLTQTAERGSIHCSTVRMNALNNCLAKLSQADRKLVEMCYADNRKVRDVASQAGRTEQAVYSAIARIRRALVSCVERQLTVECR